jgi:hypothetical protein
MMSTLTLTRDRGNRRPDGDGRGSSAGGGTGASEQAAASIAGAAPTAPASGVHVRATLLRVAWLAVGLGLVIEVSLLAVALFFNAGPDARPFLADLVQKVSWSVLICVGLAFVGAATKGSAPAMGLTGLLAAPTATVIARTLHKWMGQSIGLAMADPAGAAFFLIPTVRGLEYAFLGAALAWLGRRPWGGAIAHVTLGLGVGIAFGSMVLTVNAPSSTVGLLSNAINEVVAPLGCALTLFAGTVLGKKAQA